MKSPDTIVLLPKNPFLIVLLLCCSCNIWAVDLDLLIPGAEQGGWDMTARITGKSLIKAGLIGNVHYINASGGGGARALLQFTQDQYHLERTLMVQSTPLLFQYLNGGYKKGIRDIKPIAIVMADYQVVVVDSHSPYRTTQELLEEVSRDYAKYPILGGSPDGGLDHITASLLFERAGLSPKKIRYATSDGGGNALVRLKEGVGIALIAGYGEVIDAHQNGDVRVLGIASEQPLDNLSIPTLRSQGFDVVMMNWRGFFANKSMSKERVDFYQEQLIRLNDTAYWRSRRQEIGWVEFVKYGPELEHFLDQQHELFLIMLRTMGVDLNDQLFIAPPD